MAKNDFDARLDAASKELQKVEKEVAVAQKQGAVPEELWKKFDDANAKYREAVRGSFK